jgi:hypothetical protein
MTWLSESATWSVLSGPFSSRFDPASFAPTPRTAIAAVALLTCSGDAMARLGGPVDAQDRVAFTQREVEIAVRGHREGARALERRACHGRAVRPQLRFARAGTRLDDPRVAVNPAHTPASDIADQQAALTIEQEAVRLAEPRPRSRPAIALNPDPPVPRERADDARCAVNLSGSHGCPAPQ